MGNVKLFRNTDYGAPALYGAVGSMLQVLDACLVNGYGQRTLSSLTHSGGIVTAVCPVLHGFGHMSRQTIEGANEVGYNGEFRITVVDGYTFTYEASGITVDTATGTITSRTASAGWTKEYTGTNVAAYRQGGATNKRYIQFSDNVTTSSRVVGYETMTGIDTGTGPFPTSIQASGGLYWNKSSSADSINARNWIIVADDRTFYMWVQCAADMGYTSLYTFSFGDFDSVKEGDAYNQLICADYGVVSYSQSFFTMLSTYYASVTNASAIGLYGCRSFSQIGSSVAMGKVGDYSKSGQSYMGVGGMIYPLPTDGGLYLSPVTIIEGSTNGAMSVIRGAMRGLWIPLHTTPLANGDIFRGNGDFADKYFLVLNSTASTSIGQFFIDISMTW